MAVFVNEDNLYIYEAILASAGGGITEAEVLSALNDSEINARLYDTGTSKSAAQILELIRAQAVFIESNTNSIKFYTGLTTDDTVIIKNQGAGNIALSFNAATVVLLDAAFNAWAAANPNLKVIHQTTFVDGAGYTKSILYK